MQILDRYSMLKLENISKSFAGVPALRNVSMEIRAGRIHGVLGENGAGKSTLMNIVFGLVKADAGKILLAGKEITGRSPAAARRGGIGMVHQHFKLVPTLSVLENLVLACGSGVGAMNKNALAKRAQTLAQTMGWTLPMHRIVGGLSVGEQQRVEIVKALIGGDGGPGGSARVLILDEPTAVLTPAEFAELARAIRALANAQTAIVFISHKLAEVRAVCDEVTILRRGEVVHAGEIAAISDQQIVEKMVGRENAKPETQNAKRSATGKILLDLRGVNVRDGKRAVIENATFQARAGEIVGIAGVDGNGQNELVSAIVGSRRISAGKIYVCGEELTHASIRARMEKIAFVPGDRQREALVMPLSIAENAMLKAYRRAEFSVMGLIRGAAWRDHAMEMAQKFDVRMRDVADPAYSLSGGNQQKVILARELEGGKKIVIAVNPTRGLDVGATAFVMRQLIAARDAGAAVVLVHSDLDELLAVSDRILVMYAGRVRESSIPLSKDEIGRMMLGGDS
jgi:simple sugar transport system ATP-binding protein